MHWFCRIQLERTAWLAGVILWCCLGTGLAANAKGSNPPPNIVLLLADDLGYSDLGCYGGEISTPNLDRLAARGLQMTQFYTTPRCCPTRAALLTGVHPHQAGIGNMMEDRGIPGYRGELNKATPTIAEHLKQAGYRTAMVGKWHVSHIYFEGKKQLNYESATPFWDNQDNWPRQRGFDTFYGTIHGVNSYYDPFSLVEENTPTRPESTNFYYTDVIGERAAQFISRQAGSAQPFFMYVAFTAPHWPLQAPEADIAKYRPVYRAGWDVIRSNRYQRQIDLGIISKAHPLSPRDTRVAPWSEVKDKEWEANRMATYAAMVEHLDRSVGKIVTSLQQIGAADNTLVIFFSDNGACDEALQPGWYDVPSRTRDGRVIHAGNGDHSILAGPEEVWQSYGPPWANVGDTPFRLYKHFVHEGGIATPLIAHWPAGIKPGNGLNRQVGHVTDILATCLDAAGAEHPATFNGQATLPLEGRSLLPLFKGRKREAQPLFWEHEGHRAVRAGKWKLVARNKQSWELYDMEADRTELSNLAAKHPARVKQMIELYEAWARRCQVQSPDTLPRERPITPAAR